MHTIKTEADYRKSQKYLNQRIAALDPETRKRLKYFRADISKKTSRLARNASAITIHDDQGQPRLVSPDILVMCHKWIDDHFIKNGVI